MQTFGKSYLLQKRSRTTLIINNIIKLKYQLSFIKLFIFIFQMHTRTRTHIHKILHANTNFDKLNFQFKKLILLILLYGYEFRNSSILHKSNFKVLKSIFSYFVLIIVPLHTCLFTIKICFCYLRHVSSIKQYAHHQPCFKQKILII